MDADQDLSPASQQIAVRRLSFDAQPDGAFNRSIPVEMPVAIVVNGAPYAVMMATPADLRDYALGFALADGLVERREDLARVNIQPYTDLCGISRGVTVEIDLTPERRAHAQERARKRVAESSCGLCGVEQIEQALRPLPRLTHKISLGRKAIALAQSGLQQRQPLSLQTGAVHAAAFCDLQGRILHIREDVGRHNALDKLVGALAWDGHRASEGFILLSARCSYELVEKTVRAGCPVLVTVSAPTSLAVERARDAQLTLLSLARADSALILCDALGNLTTDD